MEMLEALFRAGVDVFRLNFSHGNAEEKRELVKMIRRLEARYRHPIGILADLQGPKLRVSTFKVAPRPATPATQPSLLAAVLTRQPRPRTAQSLSPMAKSSRSTSTGRKYPSPPRPPRPPPRPVLNPPPPPPSAPPPFRWTRLVPPPVLTGHVSSLLPY